MPRSNEDPSISMLREQGTSGLARLLDDERTRLKRVVERQLGRDLLVRVDTSDVIQELFVSAARMLDTYLQDPKLPPFLWLRGLARRIAQETVRHHLGVAKRSPKSEVRESPNDPNRLLVEELSTSMPSPGTVVADDEIKRRVNQIVASMKEADREVLTLRHVENLTLRETSVELGLPYETVKKRYARAIQKLTKMCRDQLKQDGSD